MRRSVDETLVLDPGKLRHQVVIQDPVYAKTASGADEPTWTDALSAKAFFNSPRAKKYFLADRENVEKLFPVEMWYQAGIDETKRLLFDGRAFEIMTAVDVEERHRVLYLLVRELL